MANETIDLTYEGNTSERDRKFDAENMTLATGAVFPELPPPFNNLFVKFKDLNSDSNCSPQSVEMNTTEDRREHPAVEFGVKLTF